MQIVRISLFFWLLFLISSSWAQNTPFAACDAKKYECASPKKKIIYRNSGCYDYTGCGPSGKQYDSLAAVKAQAELDFVNFQGPKYCTHSLSWDTTPSTSPLRWDGFTQNTFGASGTYSVAEPIVGCITYPISMVAVYQFIGHTCEPGWEAVGIAADMQADAAYCRKPKPRCEQYGNPCSVLTGAKVSSELDAMVGTTGLLRLERQYSSIPSARMSTFNTITENRWQFAERPILEHFMSNAAGSYTKYYKRVLGIDTAATFESNASGEFKPISVSDGILKKGPTEANEVTWLYYSNSGNKLYWFKNGTTIVWQPTGTWAKLGADSVDVFGRAYALYATPSGFEATLPDNSKIIYNYSTVSNNSLVNLSFDRLNFVTYQDGTTQSYLYENPYLPGHVTGVVDANGKRVATWSYEWGVGSGRLIQTYANAPGVRQYNYTYAGNGVLNSSVTVRTPLETTYTLNIVDTAQGRQVGSRTDGNCDDQCRAKGAIKATTFATHGSAEAQDSFNNNRVCRAYEAERLYETVRVEGLAITQVCSGVTSAGAALPAGSRKVTTQWHPEWKLRVRQAEPNKRTTWVYNGQPDPLNGGAVASCAPTSAVLPDGKPIAVLCRQVEQETTDASGSLGFAAGLPVRAAVREQKWTYNAFGQILTHDGPRTDVADITRYTYYSDTTAGHTLGDLKSVTNAAGKVVNYTQYNKHGQVLSMMDANGVVTAYTYDLRQRLKSVAVGGQLTQYGYDLAGQLKKVTQPDASTLGYDHDDAHRLTAVYDNLGNRIDYVLDNAGNRQEEKVTGAGGVLKRKLTRVIDALGRVQQTTSGE